MAILIEKNYVAILEKTVFWVRGIYMAKFTSVIAFRIGLWIIVE